MDFRLHCECECCEPFDGVKYGKYQYLEGWWRPVPKGVYDAGRGVYIRYEWEKDGLWEYEITPYQKYGDKITPYRKYGELIDPYPEPGDGWMKSIKCPSM